ncbi:SGNH/GDSL hydrolase family protein [Rhodococcoides yunnanense]|uniref:SGNH/GDSL hydrolase family protein n=1 Tax=Rhodococcoides yunnanense TaxID=278209 RepID=A0ABU4B6I2_9NOCA|nr:SGNH/GDSL hydrolase family protein [Rhodococcus yunnanensis]MDV6259789.1 SGNH/GDSL hydrolase family protein [Rhodococcus yunnanensis]
MTGNYKTVVALGSSFAAGPGIAPVENRWARRSTRNYAHLVSQALGARLTDSSVSGATTATILNKSQRIGPQRFSPQIGAVTTDTDLVTVTAGGNDVNYLGEVLRVAVLNWLSAQRVTRRIGTRLIESHPVVPVSAGQFDEASAGLERIVLECRRRAPRSRVVLVDYPTLFDKDCAPGVLFRQDDIRHFQDIASGLSGAYARAARRSGADLVAASDFEEGHGVGSDEPHVLGLERGHGTGAAFHPNLAGMKATAAKILDVVNGATTPAY